MSRRVWSALLLVVATTIAATAVAGPAAASSYGWVSAGAVTVSFSADHNAKNKIVITRSGRTVTIDDRVAVKPGKNCKQVKGDRTRVRCRTTKTPAKVIVRLYDRNDSVINKSDLRMEAYGGGGNDSLVGGPKSDVLHGEDLCAESAGNDRIYGQGGNDLIYAGDGSDYVSAGDGNDQVLGDSDCVTAPDRAGNDVIHGGNGDDDLFGDNGNDKLYGNNGNDFLTAWYGVDRIEGGAGDDQLHGDPDDRKVSADVLLGGTGRDVVEYQGYRKPLTVSLNGVSGDDGVAGEHDTVGADVERLTGGAGNDRLVGNAAANEIDGFGGNDTILGGSGNDDLRGGDGDNKLYGEAGDDVLFVYYGVGLLDGGANNDVCNGRYETVTLISCETFQPW
ncbi:calcium-binding protein [Actinoplanes flavus]|uniref:calcium-binding protein n=1 Tax=Actinoplanes flavus TaxID=2820290 RepID=UPI001EE59586|nr:calcium-binding protein [Actinoplanes flavus]